MTATIALPRQPHSDWLARIRTVGLGLGGRGVMGLGLGRSSVQAAAAAPWWLAGGAPTPVAVYQPKGAASLAASYVNLANPGTYDAAAGSAPSFDTATGWSFNGSSQYLTTGVVTARAWTWLVRFSDASANLISMGAADEISSTHYDFIRPRNNTNRQYYLGEAGVTNAGAQASGVMGRAGVTCYLNGSADGTISSSSAAASLGHYLGALNFSGNPAQYHNGKIQAAVYYDSTLNGTQVATVSAAMAAL